MATPSGQPHRRPKSPRVFYGWVIVAVVAAAGFSASTETFPVLSIFIKPITEDLGWTRTDFTVPITIGGLIGGLVALFMGPLVDRYGSRWALAIALGLLGGSFALMGAMSHLWHLYALQFVARTMNTGVLAVATAVVIPNWFIVKRGKALSLSSLGHPAGATVMPLLVQAFTATWGWRIAAVGAGLTIWIASTLPTAMFIRRRPEDMGLLPDGAPTEDLRTATPPATQDRRRYADVSVSLREASKMPALYFILVATTLWWFARTGVGLHAFPYFTDEGISESVAVTVIALHSGIGVLGTLAAGFLRDRISVRLVMAGDFVLTAAAFGLLLVADTVPLAFLWGVVYGIAQGASVPLQRLITADYFGRRHLGSIEGVARASNALAQAAGPLAASLAFDTTQSYLPIFTVFLVANIAATGMILLAHPPGPGRGAGQGVNVAETEGER